MKSSRNGFLFKKWRMHKVRAVFTVEASFLIPVITFILAGMLLLFMIGHDKTILSSYSLRASEALNFNVSRNGSEASSRVMAAEEISVQKKGGESAAAGLVSLLRSRTTSSCHVSASVPFPGFARIYAGKRQQDINVKADCFRVDYVGDIYKTKFSEDPGN